MWKLQFEQELIEIRERIKNLEKNSHPIRDFVTCNCCKKKLEQIKEK